MQIERINVRSPRVSGPGQLWEPLHWCSRGQRAPAQTSVKDELGAPSRAVKNPLKIFIFFNANSSFLRCFRWFAGGRRTVKQFLGGRVDVKDSPHTAAGL